MDELQIKENFSLKLGTKVELFQAYMPYIADGGLFIKTNSLFKLGDAVSLDLTLLADIEVYHIIGKIVWLNPRYKAITKAVVTVIVVVLTILLYYLTIGAYSRLTEQIEALGIY